MRYQGEHIINGILYNTEKADVIASDEYWDGSNHERRGRNTHLYKTKKGNYFVGYATQWQGERGFIEVVNKEEAMARYEQLPEHDVSYEDAFGITPEEA